jgi:hypothetical protein
MACSALEMRISLLLKLAHASFILNFFHACYAGYSKHGCLAKKNQ